MYAPKICIECGEVFIPNSPKQTVCKKEHYRPCPVCGKPVLMKQYSEPPRTCSSECRLELMKRTNLQKYGVENSGNTDAAKAKRRQTSLERFGTENPAQSEQVKQKIRSSVNTKYGVNNISQLEVNKQKVSDSWSRKSEQEIADISRKRSETCMEKYGVRNPAQSEEVQKRKQSNMLAAHGVQHASQLDSVKQKVRDSWNAKSTEELETIKQHRISSSLATYGVPYPSQAESVKQKSRETWSNKSEDEMNEIVTRRRQTSIENYGVNVPSQSDDVKQKTQETNLKRYGVRYPMQVEDFRESAKQTNLLRYGKEFAVQSEQVQAKRIETNLEKYGYPHPSQSDLVRKKLSDSRIQLHASSIPDAEARENYLKFAEDPERFIAEHFDHAPTYKTYSMERDVENFLRSLIPNVKIVSHSRSIIPPYEIDLYLPEYNLAIECNPTYTHNSSLPCYSNDSPLDKTYHKVKSSMCEKAGIFLFHIFGYEWTHKQAIILSMLKNILGKSSTRYYARKLTVVSLSAAEAEAFFARNHRQGYAQSSIRLGLVSDSGELVSSMLFSRMRNSIGLSASTTENSYELTRFCSRLDASVIGGASKLFNYFCKHFQFDKVVSFSDVAHTRGTLYSKLGFQYVSTSDPGYVWVNGTDDTYYHRVTCQKRNLPKLFKEPDLDVENQTEAQIMVSHEYVQVFDSGVKRWEYVVH